MDLSALAKSGEKMREDYLREIVHNMFTNDKNNRIVKSYGPDSLFSRNIEDIKSDELFTIAYKYYINKITGTTEYNDCKGIIEYVIKYLEIVNGYTNDLMESPNLLNDTAVIQRRENAMGEAFDVNDEYIDPLIQLLSYNMVRCGLVDYSSDIKYCWITNNGRACLYVLKIYLNKLESDDQKE